MNFNSPSLKYAKLTIRITFLVLALYAASATVYFFMQDKFIFQPETLAKDYPFNFSTPYTEYFIPMSDGVELNALYFETEEPALGLILYFHGNADNLQRWGNYANDLLPYGYDVLMIDYRSYGKSAGTPKESVLYSDAESVLAWAKERISYQRLVIYGRSLGSAVASKLAATTNPDLLILETPFDELQSLVFPPVKPLTFFLPKRNKFSNKENLAMVRCPVLILHGTEDWVVPLSSALGLRPLLKPGDEFIIIEDGAHADLNQYPAFHEALKKFLSRN